MTNKEKTIRTACIYHRVDLDGWMSAAIVMHWFFEKVLATEVGVLSIEFIGYHYGDRIPDLSEYDKVIMCDISFPKEEMFNLAKRLDVNFTWIDHHQPKINEVSKYLVENKAPTIDGLTTIEGRPKYAACELTWQYFFPNEPIPEIVRLLGRYDCFGYKWLKSDEERRSILIDYIKSNTRLMSQEEQNELKKLNKKHLEEQKVLEFQYGARSIISNYEEAYHWLMKCISEVVLEDNPSYNMSIIFQNTNKIWNTGKAIYKYLCTEAKQVYNNGFSISLTEPLYVNVDGVTVLKNWYIRNFLCVNKERFNPINFGIDYHADGYDGVACFWYSNGKWQFSLYNDNGKVDCSLIAKDFGGGGHKVLLDL